MAGSDPARPEDEEDDEDDEIDDAAYKTVKDAVLFAVEVSPSMMKKPPASDSKNGDNDCPTIAALKCAYQLMQQRIISNPKDMMGILLFGTRESRMVDGESTLSYPHCYLLSDLDVPAASDVKALRTLVQDEEEASKILRPAEPSGDDPGVLMSHVLFCANQIFTTKAPNFSSRRLFLVTDSDNPHPNDKETRRAATVRAKDLYDLGVIIELFSISQPGSPGGFDRSLFYDDIVYRPLSSDLDAPASISTVAKTSELTSRDGISLLQSLLSAINSKATPRRALFSLNLELGPDLRISVKGYILIKRQERVRSSYIWLEGEKPQIALGTTTRLADDTARTVEKAEVRKAYKFGGESVTFTPEEASSLRRAGGAFGEPGLRIIGFKDLDLLHMWANYRPANFIYPSEDGFIGSTRVFAALHASLLQKRKFALAWFVARRNASPVLAALIPGAEKVDNETGEQRMPPGLWAIPLPFADDVRQNPDIGPSGPIIAPDGLVDKMRVVIQQLQLPKAIYDPQRYPNPSLQWFYRILQALALEEDVPDEPDDRTVPRYRQIHKRVGDHVVDWGQELEQQFRTWQQEHGHAQKRAVANDGSGAPAKRAKQSSTSAVDGNVLVAISDDEMRKSWERNALSKLTVAQLRDWLASKKTSTVGKKAELMERVEEWFEQKG